jgi:hypothetical protein
MILAPLVRPELMCMLSECWIIRIVDAMMKILWSTSAKVAAHQDEDTELAYQTH